MDTSTMTHPHPAFMALVLAAGGGTRMKSRLPKVMHGLAEKPLIAHVLASVQPLSPQKTVLVLAPHMDEVKKEALRHLPACQFAEQDKPQGTGHAVRSALSHFKGFEGLVLVLYGDTPLIRTETIAAMLDTQQREKAAISLLGMRPSPPTGYGRLVMPTEPYVERIVECKDASESEKHIPWVWAGVMAFDAAFLSEALEALAPSPVTGEYYLTALIEMAAARSLRSVMVPVEVEEAMGINTRAQLAEAAQALQQRLRMRAMASGATLIDPATVYLCTDTQLGQDVIVHPQVVFGAGVRVDDGVEIRSFSHLEGVHVQTGATVGPFARLRPGTTVGEGAHVGNFVELKKAKLGKGAKVNHLSYVGDAQVGAAANIGAGTITCNYDGMNKYETTIGDHAFIGSNTALVAPVTVGAGAVVGAGSVVTQDVPPDSLALARGQQVNLPGRGKALKDKKKA